MTTPCRDWHAVTGRAARIAKPAPATRAANDNRRPSRRMVWLEFGEHMADRASELAALEAGLPVPPPIARRRAVPRALYRPPLVAANDNKPGCRRGNVVALPLHQEARRPAPAAPPTPDRVRHNLARTAPDAAATLNLLDELRSPVPRHAEPVVDGMHLDRRHEITPALEEEMIEALADGQRSRVVIDRKGRVERFVGGVSYHCAADGTDETVTYGGAGSRGTPFGARFYRGRLQWWVKDGRRRKPGERQTDARGPDAEPWTQRQTTASPAVYGAFDPDDAHAALADLAAQMGADAARELVAVLEADSFKEIGLAAGYAESAAHARGRDRAIQRLDEAKKILAA